LLGNAYEQFVGRHGHSRDTLRNFRPNLRAFSAKSTVCSLAEAGDDRRGVSLSRAVPSRWAPRMSSNPAPGRGGLPEVVPSADFSKFDHLPSSVALVSRGWCQYVPGMSETNRCPARAKRPGGNPRSPVEVPTCRGLRW
jgi:hypothetical protein